MSVNDASLSNGDTQNGKYPGVSALTWAADGHAAAQNMAITTSSKAPRISELLSLHYESALPLVAPFHTIAAAAVQSRLEFDTIALLFKAYWSHGLL